MDGHLLLAGDIQWPHPQCCSWAFHQICTSGASSPVLQMRKPYLHSACRYVFKHKGKSIKWLHSLTFTNPPFSFHPSSPQTNICTIHGICAGAIVHQGLACKNADQPIWPSKILGGLGQRGMLLTIFTSSLLPCWHGGFFLSRWQIVFIGGP